MTPYEIAEQRFAGKNVLILGLGLLGGAVGDTRFFCDVGANVKVVDQKTASELNPSITALMGYSVEYHLGEVDQNLISWADYIVRNPSVPENHPLLIAAKNIHKPILMRSSLFCELSQTSVIGITGTRGKTTTTMMIYEMVKELSLQNVLLAGNIAGMSDLELLKQIKNPADYIVVMELSSWQLQGFSDVRLSPHIGVITNLYPDHLNRYPNLDLYYTDKKNIVQWQHSQDYAVLNQAQPELHQWAAEIASQTRWFSPQQLPQHVSLKIPGEHNRQNASAAFVVGQILGYSESDIVRVLNQFTGVPYRLETIAIMDGITYINDTTSTTPTAGEVALNACPHPPILICGGADKNLPIETYAEQVNTRAKSIVLLKGSGTNRIKPLLKPSLILGEVDSMKTAIQLARTHAVQGDVILLSPGFASFGLFNNEFDRGEQFNQCVKEL